MPGWMRRRCWPASYNTTLVTAGDEAKMSRQQRGELRGMQQGDGQCDGGRASPCASSTRKDYFVHGHRQVGAMGTREIRRYNAHTYITDLASRERNLRAAEAREACRKYRAHRCAPSLHPLASVYSEGEETHTWLGATSVRAESCLTSADWS